MAGRRAWRILGVVALLLRGCGCLVSTRRVVARGVALFAGIPDWDSIKPEAEAKAKRMKDVRAKMNELREMKQQGRRYDGKRLDDVEVVAEAKNKRMAEAGFSQLMDEGEALFGGGAGEARKQAAAGKALREKIAKARAYQEAQANASDAAAAALAMSKEANASDAAAAILEDVKEEKPLATSGIGGNWAPPTEEETHKPKVSTWGVFERPADISKAYGGGKRIGVGAGPQVVNETKEAETRARLAAFRDRNAADERVVDAHWAEIEGAVNASKRLVSRGLSYEAVLTLRPPIERWCTPKTRRGAEALLELALAHEAAGEGDAAMKVYAALVLSPIADVKRRAKQLSFGFEAAATLGVGGYAGSEAAKLAAGAYDMDWNMARREEKTYSRGTQLKLSSSRKNVALESRRDVDEALRRASIGRDAFVPPDVAGDALRKLDAGTYGGPPTSPDALTKRLGGDWVVVLEAPVSDPKKAKYLDKFAPPTLRVDDAEVVRTSPALFGTVTWTGTVKIADESSLRADKVDVSPSLAAAFSDASVALDLLHLQDGVCAVKDATKASLLLLKQTEKRSRVRRA